MYDNTKPINRGLLNSRKNAIKHAVKIASYEKDFHGLRQQKMVRIAELNKLIGYYYLHTAYAYDQAVIFYQRAFDITVHLFGEVNRDTACIYHNLAISYEGLNNFEKSLELYKKSLILLKLNLG